MQQKTSKFIYWFPRILSIVYLVFISIFALDAFGEGLKWWEMLVGFVMHMIPTFIGVIILMFAWKKELVGVILFAILGLLTIFAFDTHEDLIVFLLISLPLFVVAGCFYLSLHYSKKAIKQLNND